MEVKKVWAEEHKYHCNTCGKDFIIYRMSGFRYGEGFYLTEDGSMSVYMNNFEDEAQEEFSNLLKKFYPFRKNNQLGDEFMTIFGICCDEVKGKKIDSSRFKHTCYYCASEDIICLKEDLENKEVVCPVVTHHMWNKLDNKTKKELIYNELKRRKLL